MFSTLSRGLCFFTSCLLIIGATVSVGQNLDCDFEKDFCKWTQLSSDEVDWLRNVNATPSSDTGPNHDHTTGSGYYAYMEASSVDLGSRAQLQSPPVTICQGGASLSFYYHMFGTAMGSLKVYGANNNIIWQRSGNVGNHWNLAQIHIPQGTDVQFIIEAKRGSDYQSDIAIDDITFKNNQTNHCPPKGFRFDFVSSPLSVSPPFTKELKINCSLEYTGKTIANQPVSQENITHLVSIVVTHDDTHVATVSQFEPARGLVDGNQLFVTGSVSDVTDAYLELTWQSPNSNQAGNYTCEMNAVNEFSHTVVFTKTLAVGVSDLTLERLAQVVEQQDKTISQLDNTIQTLQTTISQLESNVYNILNNSGLANQTLSSQHIETGYGNCGNSDYWAHYSSGNRNESTTYIMIKFNKPYEDYPRLDYAISRIETTNNNTEGLRVSVSMASVTKYEAGIRCFAVNTHVKEMSFLWIAHGRILE